MPIEHLAGRYNNEFAKLVKGIWPWTKGVRSRLPDHYKRRYLEAYVRQPEPVYFKPNPAKYIEDEWGHRTPVINYPIPLTYPREAHKGIWGGEALIDALKSKDNNPKKPRMPYLWVPKLERHVIYSEILDKYMAITVTKRTLQKIDESYGFDSYILKTPECELVSNLAMKLKQLLLRKIAEKKLSSELIKKYKIYEIPLEEVEFFGLTIEEAEEKQISIENGKTNQLTKPMKYYYLKDLVEKIKLSGIDGLEVYKEHTFFEKINPFKKQP